MMTLIINKHNQSKDVVVRIVVLIICFLFLFLLLALICSIYCGLTHSRVSGHFHCLCVWFAMIVFLLHLILILVPVDLL